MKIFAALALTTGAAALEVALVTYDGADGSVPLSKWAAMSDPFAEMWGCEASGGACTVHDHSH